MAIGIVIGVHYQQQSEKTAMHAGVIRDMEQLRVKKERQEDFDLQRVLEKEYRKVQHVSSANDLDSGPIN